jgi:hypothetical protein
MSLRYEDTERNDLWVYFSLFHCQGWSWCMILPMLINESFKIINPCSPGDMPAHTYPPREAGNYAPLLPHHGSSMEALVTSSPTVHATCSLSRTSPARSGCGWLEPWVCSAEFLPAHSTADREPEPGCLGLQGVSALPTTYHVTMAQALTASVLIPVHRLFTQQSAVSSCFSHHTHHAVGQTNCEPSRGREVFPLKKYHGHLKHLPLYLPGSHTPWRNLPRSGESQKAAQHTSSLER